jgi:hypothetical protein
MPCVLEELILQECFDTGLLCDCVGLFTVELRELREPINRVNDFLGARCF